MYFFVRQKIFLYGFYLIFIIGFVLINYKIVNEYSQMSIKNQQPIKKVTIQLTNIPLIDINTTKCLEKSNVYHRNVRYLIRRDEIFNYVSFVIRSHSLFYCSVPKVATRTLLLLITYLHIRDDLIPILTNYSNTTYFNHIAWSSLKNNSQLTTLNSVSYLQSFLSELLLVNSSKLDLWSLYQNKIFPSIRLNTLSNPSSILSSNYIRIIFVRHPLERLASAYIDKINTLQNKPFTLYDNIRRAICRKYSFNYLTEEQRFLYRTIRNLKKELNEPCQNVTPRFEHFIEYLIRDPLKDDVHWKPYSRLCHVCLFKYNFIGKMENFEEDFKKLIHHLGLETNHWFRKNYFTTGKTKENYKLLYSNLNQKTTCFLKDFYQMDFQLFNYNIHEYFTPNQIQPCANIHYGNKFRTKFF